MHIIDSHFHWWPRSVFEVMNKRSAFPYTRPNAKGCYTCYLQDGPDYVMNLWPEWFDLEDQFAHMDKLGHQIDAVGSIGPFSVYFSALPESEGRDLAIQWQSAFLQRGHAAGMRFAIDYYGIDHVMYGTDYPCWDPATCLRLIEELNLSPADQDKLFRDNARRILGLNRGVAAAAE